MLLVEGLRLLDHWLNRRLVSVGDSGEGRVNFFFISVFLKRNNINVDSKSMLITKRVEKDTASDAKTSKTYLFFRVFVGFCYLFSFDVTI